MNNAVLNDVLGEDLLERLNGPIEEARGLPPKAYTSDAVFELERDRLFRGGWMGVAFGHDIPDARDAMPLTVAGVEIILARGKDGVVRAFHNVCRHRASTILQEPAKGLSALTCPYHCWSYDLDGRLRGAPMWEGPRKGRMGSLDPEENALLPIACAEWQDLIFVNISGDASSIEEFVAPLDERWQHLDLLAMKPFAHSERVIAANWKVVLEGFLEVYHENSIHDSLGYRIDAEGKPSWADVMVGDVMGFEGVLPASDADDPGSELPRVPGLPTEGPVSADIFLLFPATSINVMDNHIVRTIWTPVSATETRWRSCWYFADEVFGSETMRKAGDEIVEFWHVIRNEDLGAILGVQKGMSSWDSAPKEVKFAPFWEEIVRHFQRHIARGLA